MQDAVDEPAEDIENDGRVHAGADGVRKGSHEVNDGRQDGFPAGLWGAEALERIECGLDLVNTLHHAELLPCLAQFF
ncbi:hypothetical protein G6F68_020325 [Rhizopus microsporus]|nr:hypothetical protein G6F68_020325 [Rhizopus microsporus]